MPLVTASQFGLQPDVQGAVQQGLKTRMITQEMENQERLRGLAEQQRQTRLKAVGLGGQQAADDTQEQAQLRMIADDQELAERLLNATGIKTQAQKEEAASFSSLVLSAPPENRNEMINARALKLQAEGRDATQTLGLLDQTPEQQEMSLKGLNTAALTALQRAQLTASEAAGAGKPTVRATKILPGGVVQTVMSDNTTSILTPEEADKRLIEAAEVRGAELQGFRAGEREEAKNASKLAIESFKGLSTIRSNIGDYEKAISYLDEGAGTGRIEGMFPSFKAASQKLDHIQNKLGLNVVQMTTFGALSEKELEFAKEVAMPKNLSESQLKQWLVDKKAAQEKVAANLEQAAIYLGTPSRPGEQRHTIAGFLEMKQAEQEKQGTLPEGVTEDDIQATMTANNMTREQVLARIGGQ
jgi:hypothetical protein